MSRPLLLRLRLAVLLAILAALSVGCTPALGGRVAGPGMTHRMGQGTTRCTTTPPTAGTTVRVVLMDMGRPSMMRGPAGRSMMRGRMVLRAFPHVVPAGRVTLVAVDRGTRRHELVVLPLAPRARVGTRAVGPDRRVDESASLGEASRSCGAGAGEGLAPGTVGWTTLRLTPGRYELVCNRPGHYAHGMYAELVVR